MAKSKVALAKEEMKWTKDSPKCTNCKHFTSNLERNKGYFGDYTKEVGKRCTIGEFATGLSCWCDKHELKG